MPTRIAVPIMLLSDVAADRKTALAAVQAGADLIEWRLDSATPAAVDSLFSDPSVCRIPWILTVRSKAEGGRFGGDESARLALIRAAIRHRPEFLDLELRNWIANPQLAGYYRDLPKGDRPKLILSSHYFSGRPQNPSEILAAIAAQPEAAVAKIAFTAAGLHHALDALDLYAALKSYPHLHGVFIAMGEHGAISRTLAGKYGAAFTFGILPGGDSTAPGQPSVGELQNIYRVKQQQSDWCVCGLVGWPVAQSVSPHMHNAAMAAAEFPGVYVRFPLPGDMGAFQQALDRLQADPQLNLRGLSITIPHKEHACRFVKAHGGEIRGRDVGAINTIVLRGSAPPTGLNTDAPGGLGALLGGTGWRPADLKGRRIAILGAGGAAAGLAAILAEHGCELVIYNRSLPRAQALSEQIVRSGGICRAEELDGLQLADIDVLIQCTPVGMYPKTDEMPVPENLPLRPGTVVMDTIYNPRRTKLLQWAAAHGGVCIEGVEMLVGQGALQFQYFTGREAPTAIMRKAALQALGL
jgi:3-dehydroquinate dehydratase/shikimate dehydrogenase